MFVWMEKRLRLWTIAILAGVVLYVGLCFVVARRRPVADSVRDLSQAELVQKLNSHLITRVEILYPDSGLTNRVRGAFAQTDLAGQVKLDHGRPIQVHFRARVRLTPELESRLLSNTNAATVERSRLFSWVPLRGW